MISRPIIVSVIFAVTLVLAAPPAHCFADPLTAAYSLKYYRPPQTPPPNARPIQQIAFSPDQPNLNLQPQTNPLLNPKGTGFDPANLAGFLGAGQIPSGLSNAGSTVQVVGLDFSPPGFQPNNQLDFQLPLVKGQSPPKLNLIDYTKAKNPPHEVQYVPNTPGLSLELVNGSGSSSSETSTSPSTPLTSSPGTPLPPNVNTPEPLSLVVWSMLACLGIVRVRGSRRATRSAD